MVVTNNITRFLDSRKVKYAAHELPAEKLGALEAAQFLGVPPEQVFKTIVTVRERGKPVLVVIPGTHVVDLKLLASFLGEKKMRLPTEREAEVLTGLQAGGISPLALINKGFQVVVDSSAQSFNAIFVSGGQRGVNIQIVAADFLKLVNARLGDVSRVGWIKFLRVKLRRLFTVDPHRVLPCGKTAERNILLERLEDLNADHIGVDQ